MGSAGGAMLMEMPICAKAAVDRAAKNRITTKRTFRIVLFTCPIDSNVSSYVAQRTKMKLAAKFISWIIAGCEQTTLGRPTTDLKSLNT
jgi:hypothetical protein